MKLIVLDRLVALKEVPAHEKVLQVMMGRLTVRKLSFSIDKHYVNSSLDCIESSVLYACKSIIVFRGIGPSER